MYHHIEYPKALYLNGQYAEVKNKDEEEDLNEQGWTDWNTDHKRMHEPKEEKVKAKPGPKPKHVEE